MNDQPKNIPELSVSYYKTDNLIYEPMAIICDMDKRLLYENKIMFEEVQVDDYTHFVVNTEDYDLACEILHS